MTRSKSPAFSIGHDAKGKLARSTALEAPGPGAYNTFDGIGPQQVSSKQSAVTVKFGTSKRDAFKPSEAPGPGAYTAPGEIHCCFA